jgi:hypothetical protein
MKTKILLITYLSALLFLLSIPAIGQSPDKHVSQNSVIFLNTNVFRYLAGDTVLFKAYITDDASNLTKESINNLNVAILDQQGLEVGKGIFPVQKHQAAGTILLSDLLTDGNYILVASPGPGRRATRREVFSKVIEIVRHENEEFSTVINLTDTLYKPGSLLTAKIRFSGKRGDPVPSSFNYRLTGASGEIFAGKSKSGKDGTGIITIQLPAFNNEENIKLFVTA